MAFRFIASDAAGIRELVAPEDRARVLFDPTRDALVAALRLALANGDALRPARAAFDDEESLRRWEHVLALPAQPPPGTGARALEPGWMVLRDDGDVAGPDLVETLVRAQQVSGADVVTCGVSANGTTHLFPGQPGALGLLANGYGTVALVRRRSGRGQGGRSALAAAGAARAWRAHGSSRSRCRSRRPPSRRRRWRHDPTKRCACSPRSSVRCPATFATWPRS